MEGFDPKVLLPSPKQVAVARAYIEGLERDRARLVEIEEKLQKTVWEAVQLGGYNRALYQVLYRIVQAANTYPTGDLNTPLDRAENLLDANRPIYETIWSCACGHSTYDHDEFGCQYLGCKPICGGGE